MKLAAFILTGLLVGSLVQAETYEAAAGRVDITPEIGTYLAGYGPNRVSTGTIDPLWAHALVVADSSQVLVIVSLDNIGLTRPHIQMIRRLVANEIPGVPAVPANASN